MVDLEIYKTNNAFSKIVPKLQIFWDSTSIGAFKKCRYYYYLNIILGLRSHSKNADLEFGILLHSALERYDHAKLSGLDHNRSTITALKYAMIATWDKTFKRSTLDYHELKNRYNLMRTIVWYCDNYKDDPVEILELSNGKPAVELSFRIGLNLFPKESPSEQYHLCGHIDKIGLMGGTPILSDKKTTKHQLDDQFFSNFTPDNQITGYNFAGRIISASPIKDIMIDGIQVGQTFNRFQRRLVSRTEEQIEEWLDGLKVLFSEAETCAATNNYPQNEKSCFRCEMRGLCSKPKSQREDWMKVGFVQKVWDPTISRGDI